MTSKLTITRERLEEIRDYDTCVTLDESAELARMALAAMDSEPVAEVCEDYAIRYISNGPAPVEGLHPGDKLYRHAQQPMAESEFIPKNLDKALGVLGMAIPESREEFNFQTERWIQRLIDRVIRYADEFKEQPEPVVPEDVLEALQKVARIRLDMNDFDGDRRGIADCLGDAEEALIEVVNRRAAMLQAGNSPVIPDSSVIGWIRTDYQQDFQVNFTAPQFIMGANDPSDAWGVKYMPVAKAGGQQNAPQNIPEIIPAWIPVSERMPDKNQDVLISVNFDSDLVEPLICSARYTGSTFRRGDATVKPGSGVEQVTHWMALPAAPQEVK